MKRGERIRSRREELGISQAELARMLKKTRSLVSYIEKTGKVNDLTYYDILKKLELSPETKTNNFLLNDSHKLKNRRCILEMSMMLNYCH